MVKKHTNRGKTTWCFVFDAPGSTRAKRDRIRKFGFATKKEAQDAETAMRVELNKTECLANPTSTPLTLDVLFEKFFELHCSNGNLSPKTVERYRDHKAYLNPKLLGLPPANITQLDWTAEWQRLGREGGRTRRNRTPRPLGAATVEDIAGTVSSVYSWGAKQGFVTANPVRYSERPKVEKREAVTVSDADVHLLLSTEAGFWCQPAYLATAEALGKRRGELCALRWSDWRAGAFIISRSLAQFKDKETGERRLLFKSTKGKNTRPVTVPASLVPVLEKHRQRQNELKRQLGDRYQDNDLIFCQEDGRPLWPNSVSASVSFLCRRLGLPKGTSLHSLRHTHGSLLLDQGVPLAEVSFRLGHANTRITAEVYAHHLAKQDERAAEAYDQYRLKQKAKQAENHGDLVQ
jgi:integrase